MSFYLKSNEKFDVIKFVSTTAVGVCIGAVMIMTGSQITEASMIEQLGVYSMLIFLLENAFKTISSKLYNK